MGTHSSFAFRKFIFLLLSSFLFFFAFSVPRSLEASLFNPLWLKDQPGFEAFLQGKTYFEAEEWKKAIDCFKQAIQESRKPVFYLPSYRCFERGGLNITRFDGGYLEITDEDCEETAAEIDYSLYRHSHFYLGLISLYQRKIKTAHFHFMKAISFEGKKIDPDYFQYINYLNPGWIIQASLTSLSLGNVNLAAQLSQFALETHEAVDDFVDSSGLNFYWWDHTFLEKYQDDLRHSNMNRKWNKIQKFMIYNLKSLVAHAQNDLKEAIKWISWAIDYKDMYIKFRELDENPEYAVLYTNRGIFYLEIQDHVKALADFTKAIELDPFHAHNYANRGFFYLTLKEYGQALEDYNKALELDPGCLDFYKQRALCHFCQHSLGRASSDLLIAKSIENQKRYKDNETGLDFFGKGEFQQSIQSFDHLIEANPTDPVGYQNRGAAHYQLGSVDLAIDDFDHALQFAPQKGELYAMRGAAYLSAANFEKAQKDLLKAVQLNSEWTAAYKNLAALYYGMDHLDEALRYCLEILSSDPKIHPELLRDLAIIYFAQENYAEALTYCKKVIDLGEATTTIYFIQGLCLFEDHQFEEAIKSYDLALASDPSLSQVYFNRGQAYYCLLNLEKARADFDHAIELDPINPVLYKSRGLVLLNLHREEEAYHDFFTAIKLAGSEEPENQKKNQLPLVFGSPDFHSLPPHIKFERVRPFLSELSVGSDCSVFSNGPVSMSCGLFIDYQELLGPHAFHQGLIVGITEGGIEGLKELGPFLAQLLFHPIDTTEELFESLKLLMSYIAKEEWDKVCASLAPELRELYLTWDEIEDYQRGVLAGRFIGKNGIGVLVGAGVMKSSATLKKAYLSGKTKMFSALKKSPPMLPPALPLLPALPTPPKESWALAYKGGEIIGKGYDNEHALARIVPKPDVEVQNMLQKRAVDKAMERGVPVKTWEDVEKWTKTTKEGSKVRVDPREISPMVMEAEIINPGSAGVEVVLNEEGGVLSAAPIKELKAPSQISKVAVRNINSQIHIMQPKHAWEKLIELTGNVEEDCKNVIKLLEDNQIFLEKYQSRPPRTFTKSIRYDYKMEIGGCEVRAVFNKDLETGEIFLNDAWVITE